MTINTGSDNSLTKAENSLKILWVLPYSPWPTTSGGKTRQYHLIRKMAEKGHRITLLIQSKTELSNDAKDELEKISDKIIVLPRRPLKHPLTLWLALFSTTPLLASINGFSKALSHTFKKLLLEKWDIVQIEHSYTLQPFLKILREQKHPFLLTEHNVESSLGGATYQRFPFWLSPYVAYDKWRYRRWEKNTFTIPSALVAVTEEDAKKLGHISNRKVEVVVNGVDTQAFAGVRPTLNSKRILFVGNFEYPPNQDAIYWSMEEILPRIWKKYPDARFVVCGFALPEEWKKRWSDERIEWLGFTKDLTVEQNKSAAFLVPIREGGGSKLKVLEAMAAGLPIVSTSQGVSGLFVQKGRHYLGGDQAKELADDLIQMLNTPIESGKIGEAGRQYVLDHHDWAIAANQLEAIYREMPHANRD